MSSALGMFRFARSVAVFTIPCALFANPCAAAIKSNPFPFDMGGVDSELLFAKTDENDVPQTQRMS